MEAQDLGKCVSKTGSYDGTIHDDKVVNILTPSLKTSFLGRVIPPATRLVEMNLKNSS